MVRFIQINLNRSPAARDMMYQVASERKADVLIISEQNRNADNSDWLTDKRNDAAILVTPRVQEQKKMIAKGNGYVRCVLGSIAVYSCYYSPNSSLEAFQADLEELEDSVRQWSGPVVVAGDFNAKSKSWSSGPQDKRGQILDELMISLDLIVINHPGIATFERRASSSVLDIAFTRPTLIRNLRKWEILEEESLSDHRYVYFDFECQNPKVSQNPSKGWAIKRLNRDVLVENIRRLTIEESTKSPEELTQDFTEAITRVCDASMPRRGGHRNHKPAYWWNQEIAKLRNTCKQQRRKAQRARKKDKPDKEDKEDRYKNTRKALREAINLSKRQCWKQLCKDVDRDPWGIPYRLVMRKLRSNKGQNVPRDKKTVLKIVEALFPKGEPRKSYPAQDEISVPLFQLGELTAAAKRLENGKAPGPDCIPNEVLKLVVKENPALILNLFNACLRNGSFPRQWKRQKLVLIPKGKDRDPADPSAYRPLGMLDTTGKLYERMILNRIQPMLDNPQCEGLSQMQFGFRKGRSTLHAVQEVQKGVIEAFSMKPRPGGFCLIVTIDVKNAFNTASWEHIYQAIQKILPEYLLRVESDYLDNRVLLIETEDGTVEVKITAGVAQGSVEGPQMWNFQYDELLRVKVPDGVTLIGYADDVAILVVAETTQEAELKCNETLEIVSDWMKDHNLKLAQEKSEAVLITKRRKFDYPQLELDGHVIQFQDSIRYLGVFIDKNWSFKNHLENASAKADRIGTSLQQLMPNVGGPKPESRALLGTVVHSVLLYGAPIWGIQAQISAISKHMGPVQRKVALRVISGYRSISRGAALLLAGMAPIWLLAKERASLWEGQQRDGAITRQTEIKEEVHEALVREWQGEWDAYPKGRWTYRLINCVKDWIERKHGTLDYSVTQVLSGHGCFGAYLYTRKKRDTAICQSCGAEWDDAEHAIFACEAHREQRAALQRNHESTLRPETIVSEMLLGQENWNRITDYLRYVVTAKEELERTARRAQEE